MSSHEDKAVELAVLAIQRRAETRSPFRVFSPFGIARRSISRYRDTTFSPVMGDRLARQAVCAYQGAAQRLAKDEA